MKNPELKYNTMDVDFFTVNEDSYEQLQKTQELYYEGHGVPLFLNINLINLKGKRTRLTNVLTLPPLDCFINFMRYMTDDVPNTMADSEFTKIWS